LFSTKNLRYAESSESNTRSSASTFHAGFLV
jgi:hypothetical protein